MRRTLLPLLAALLAGVLAGCASAPVRLVDLEDFLYPVPLRGTLRARDVDRLESAWHDLMRGKAAKSERKFLALGRIYPRAASPGTGVGYARLRAQRNDAALSAFVAVLESHPSYVPALIGAATAARRTGDTVLAVDLYRRALAADPNAPAIVRRRLGETKMEVTEGCVQAARRALEAGQPEQAVMELRRGLRAAPEVSALRISLADLLAQRGNNAEAVEVLANDPTHDRQITRRLGALLMRIGEPERARQVYARALATDPSDIELTRLVDDARRAAEFLRMPEEYRHIFDAPRLTRADLAALLAVKVAGLMPPPEREPPVATDISGSWARDHVLRVLALGMMDVFPNHTFKPGETVRRGDLAQTVAQTLALLGRPAPPMPRLPDMSPAHLHYRAAARAVAEGIMDLTPEGHFEPWRAVTGPEAVVVVDALARLAAK